MSNTNEFIIDTELNTDGAIKGAGDLVRHLKMVSQTVTNVNKTTKVAFRQVISDLDSANKAYERQKAKVDELQKKYDEMPKAELSKEYQKELQKELKLEDKKNDLLAKIEQIQNSSKSSKAKKTAIENIRQQLEMLEKQKAAQADVLEYMQRYGEAYDRSKSDNAKAKLDEEKTKLTDLGGNVTSRAQEAVEAERQVQKESGKTDSKLAKIANTAKKVGGAIVSAFGRGVKGAIKGVGNTFDKLKNTIHKSNNGFKGGFRNILKYAFGIRSTFVLINKLRRALVDGMGNLAQVDDRTNKSISGLKSSLTQLKNSFATAFAPLVNIVAPILTGFINQLSQVVTMLGMLFAKLTGAGSFKKAVAVQEDYAASLKKTGKSAKSTTLAIDELNISAEESDSGAGGTSPADMFEEVEIPDNVSNFATKLKEMFDVGDFTELGAKLGDKVVKSLTTLGGKWGEIRKKSEKIGTSIGTFINGFIETSQIGTKIGETIGNVLNTGIDLAHGFVTSLHWDSLGSVFASSFNGMLKTLDWSKAGETFGKGFGGIIEGAKTFLKEFDWRGLAKDIATFFKNVDWGYVVEQIAGAFGAALGGITAFLHETLIEVGEMIHEGFKDGIINGFANIGQWIIDKIFTPFIDAFKAAFGIHSPSTVMEEQGGYIMAGLLEGITNHFQPILDKFGEIKTKITDTIANLKDSVVNLWSNMWDDVKGIINVFITGVEKFCNAIIKAINTVFNWLNSLHIDVPPWVTDKFGITSFGFNLPTLSEVEIPRLATGTVVPRQSKEFAAILGDNNQETEVVSPLSTIQEAVAEVLEPYLKELVDKTQQLIEKETDVYIGDKDIARANRRGEKKLGYVMTS